MKKIIFIVMMSLVCFAVSVNAATSFKINVSTINEEANSFNGSVYTTDFGDSIITDEINAVHGFGDFYVVTVVPKNEGEDATESDSENEESGESTDQTVSTDENSSESQAASSEDAASENQTSEEVSLASGEEVYFSGEGEDNNRQTGIKSFFKNGREKNNSEVSSEEAANYNLKNSEILKGINRIEEEIVYSVKSIYSPGTEDKDVVIPEGGFVLTFPSSTENVSGDKIVSGKNITVGDVVRIHGIDPEMSTLTDDAYVEIELTNKDLMEDVPQTGDKGAIVFFCMIGVVSVFVALGAYRKMKKDEESI